MKTCEQCHRDFDTSGAICIECIQSNWEYEKAHDGEYSSRSATSDFTSARVNGLHQDVESIYRADNVFLNSLPDSNLIPPDERKNIDIDHYYLCVNSIIFDTSGVEYPDWNERMVNHIRDIKRKILALRVSEGSARRALSEHRHKKVESIPQEDRDVYIRDIERGKLKSDVKFEKIEAKKNSAISKQIERLLKIPGMNEDNQMIKDLRKLEAH